MTRASQLPLPFAQAPLFGAEDFMPSRSNEAAIAAVASWPRWPDHVLMLLGPEGSGKSHLAQIWAARAGAVPLRTQDVLGDPREIAGRPAVIEDADRAALPEVALFHLLNLVREQGGSLLVTARRPPAAWPLATPDLVSRLRLALTVSIDPPDDALMRAVLVKLFADRQLAVDEALVDYLALHVERSLSAARRAVDMLDRASLDSGHRIGRALASRLFGNASFDAN